MISNSNHVKISIKGVYSFADDYLTTIFFLLGSARKNKNDNYIFTYTLPIIILSVCFLESNINNIMHSFSRPNNYIKDYQQALIVNNLIMDFKIADKSILEKYALILKYYKGVNIKSDNRYERVKRVIDVRNTLVHDKQKNDEQEIMDIVREIKKLYRDFTIDNNINGVIPPWLPYLGYSSTCWMVKCVFDFYLYYIKLLFDKDSIQYELKIKDILKHITP